MTLRSRLVAAIVALAALGLVVFGVVTSALYARSLDDQLDEALRSNARGQGGRLLAIASFSEIDPTTCEPVGSATTPSFVGGPGPAPGQGLDAYTELRTADGTVAACSLPVSTDGTPDLPDTVELGPDGTATFDVGSQDGSGTWRVLAISSDLVAQPPATPGTQDPAAPGSVVPVALANGQTSEDAIVLVATRTEGVDASIAQLQRIELVAALVLLAALGGGSWLVLRRGLRPLETMAASASTITSTGDLTERVAPADGRTEVGQLGLALNTMLDGIEDAFLERDATEARLRQFLADASHELRTPLTSIQGYTELYRLTGGGPGPDGRPMDLPLIMGRIEAESERMRGLVEDLLLLARLDEPSATAREQVDLALVAAEACSSVAGMAVDHPITLDAPAPVTVTGVSTHLHRAITNLVANAIRHTPAGTPIEVTVVANAVTRTATVVVRDHGPGLPPDGLTHAFDRFWQADAARAGSGSGLGLSIVAGIAAEHGGRALAANAPDGGAVLTIELPLAAGSTTAPGPPAGATTPAAQAAEPPG